MLIIILFIFLVSNTVTTRRDKSTLYSRVAIIILVYSSFLCYNDLNIPFSGVDLYVGLFYEKYTTFIMSSSYIFLELNSSLFSIQILKTGRGFKSQGNALSFLLFPFHSYGMNGKIRRFFRDRLEETRSAFFTNTALDNNMAEFYEWFVGFSDAEASFSIVPKLDKNQGKINRFSFMFAIGLHIDDIDALTYIKTKLGIGNVRETIDECKFVVSDKDGINILISIFDKYNLNTSKYLDYFSFKKAFNLYHEREEFLTEELKDKVLELKNGMNTSRINFSMPKCHNIIITKNWLLGFVEGEGSFHLWRKDLSPVFALALTEKQLPVLIKIKEFLENNLEFDYYSLYKLSCSSAITVNYQKARKNSKPSAMILIKNIHILHNFLLPFFEGLEFKTKKGKDFLDFKLICKVVYIGAHKIDEIKSLILKLSLTMNNFRLSTYTGSVVNLSEDEKNILINASPTIEHLSDGRQRDIYTKKVIHQHTSSVYEIIKPDGVVLIKDKLSEAAAQVGVDVRTLSKHLDVDLNGHIAELKGYSIKRIPVFYKSN